MPSILRDRLRPSCIWFLRTALLLVAIAFIPGCFSEQSFPLHPERIVHLAPAQAAPNGQPLTTRAWVATIHTSAASLLPRKSRDTLLTDDLSPSGKPINVWSHFHLDPAQLDSIWHNLDGIEQTAQVTSPPTIIEAGHIRRDPWPNFVPIDVPVTSELSLPARLGIPDPRKEIKGSYIIFTHGLFGTLDGYDVHNQVEALRQAGHHVLALEMRGHGETLCEHPECVISFGIYESGDLLAAARWLKQTQGATRVGLACFSLTGYEALLTAWLDGTKPVLDFSGVPLLAALPVHQRVAAFNGGMFVVSAPVGVVGVADRFDRKYCLLEAPVKATFQEHIAARLAAYHQPPGYSMWELAREEFLRSDFARLYSSFDACHEDLMRFIDLSRDHWQAGAARMENIRVPVLVLSAANDPLASAQSIAELFGRTKNPNIGVIVLQQGGHMGFTAVSADYYFSLMLNFFDPATAPAAMP